MPYIKTCQHHFHFGLGSPETVVFLPLRPKHWIRVLYKIFLELLISRHLVFKSVTFHLRSLTVFSHSFKMAEKASFWSRFLAIPALAITTSVAILLLVITIVDYKSDPHFATVVADNATLVNQAIHIVSRLLGTLFVYVICTSTNPVYARA